MKVNEGAVLPILRPLPSEQEVQQGTDFYLKRKGEKNPQAMGAHAKYIDFQTCH